MLLLLLFVGKDLPRTTGILPLIRQLILTSRYFSANPAAMFDTPPPLTHFTEDEVMMRDTGERLLPLRVVGTLGS